MAMFSLFQRKHNNGEKVVLGVNVGRGTMGILTPQTFLLYVTDRSTKWTCPISSIYFRQFYDWAGQCRALANISAQS